MEMPSINMMKRGNAFKLWTVLLLTVGIWCTGVQSHTIRRTDEDSKFGVPNYPTVVYELNPSYPDAYREMIARLRQLLTSHGEYRQGIPVLREARYVHDSERYVLLQINVRGQSVTFAIDVTNVYIVGYLIGNTRYFFEEAPPRADQLLFIDAPATSPNRRSSNYGSLENRAHRSRTRITLGLRSMENAIGTLVNTNPEDAQSLIIVIQMVAEAVRYWEIEWYTLRDGAFLPDSRMIDLENNWAALSRQIQISEVFAFERPININGQVVDSVLSPVTNALFLMLFICRQPPPAVSFEPLLQMTRLDPEEGSCKRLEEPAGAEIIGRPGLRLDPLQMVRSNLEEEDDDTCKRLVDPRSRIKGRDGLCVDVQNFRYEDNNPVILFDCKNSDLRNQLWNFRRDGRIVSLEKCLAASGDTPGSTVMIHECDTLHESAVEWTLDDQGTLSHTHSGLVLTAASGVSAQLTLESNSSSSFQAWESTNTSAADVYIHGENNECIYYDGKDGVYTEQCHKDYSRQKWKLYPDGTIRPIDWLEGCMELKSLSSVYNYNYIQAGYCSSSPEYHRWMFTHQGSIMNLKSQLVVDADKESPGYLKAAPFKGGPNQIWTLDFM